MKDPIQIHFTKSANLQGRIDALRILYEKAESKVLHADQYRQKNLNYALLIFAGLFAIAVNAHTKPFSTIILIALTILMIIFTIWDRRWHRTKHGWDHVSDECYRNIINHCCPVKL